MPNKLPLLFFAESVFGIAGDIIVMIVASGGLLGFIGIVIYWFIWGRSKEQVEEKAALWKDAAERLRGENSDCVLRLANRDALIVRLRKARLKDKQIIYRLVARLEGEEIDIEDIEIWEEV